MVWCIEEISNMRRNHRTRVVALIVVVLLARNLVAQLAPTPEPAPAPARWRGLIGEYGPDNGIVIIFEEAGQLRANHKNAERERLEEISRDVFHEASSAPHYGQFVFARDRAGRATQLSIDG